MTIFRICALKTEWCRCGGLVAVQILILLAEHIQLAQKIVKGIQYLDKYYESVDILLGVTEKAQNLVLSLGVEL